MYPYIVCYCGRSLGDIFDIFKLLRLEKYMAAYEKSDGIEWDIDPTMLAISEVVDIDLSDVFDQLRIYTDCCRSRLMSQVEFKEYY